MNVLVVEDQSIAGLMLKGQLSILGHEVELVTDGKTALEKIASGAFRIVVCDWRMPAPDGLEVCRQMRAMGGDYIYFILVSLNKLTKANWDLALAAGVDDFMSRPLELDDLERRLHVAERIVSASARIQTLEEQIVVCPYCRRDMPLRHLHNETGDPFGFSTALRQASADNGPAPRRRATDLAP